jgi:hypothetical protein
MKIVSTLILGSALLFACSSSSSGNGGSGGDGGVSCTGMMWPSDPCSVISQAQLGTILGIQLDAGQGSPPTCDWSHHASPNDLVDGVEVSIGYTGISPRVSGGTFQNDCRSDDAGLVENVSGVGDDACYNNAPPVTSFSVLKGCLTFLIGVRATGTYSAMFPEATIKADEKAIALAVLPNIQ